MATFNPNILQTYFDTRNYLGAAKYLESIPAKNAAAEKEKRSRIAKLKRDAGVQQSMLNELDKDKREAYTFIQGINGIGEIPRNRNIIYNAGTESEYVDKIRNNYGTKYFNYINNLVSDDGKDINKIAIDVNDDDTLKSLSSILGIKDINKNDIGVDHFILGDGKHRLMVNTNNKNLYKVLNAVDDVTYKSTGELIDNMVSDTAAGATTGSLIGSLIPGIGTAAGFATGAVTGLVKGVAEETYDYFTNRAKINIRGVGVDGTVYDSNKFNYDNIENALELVNDAKDIYDEVNANQNVEQEFTSEVSATPFLSLGHANAYKKYQQGIYSESEFNSIETRWKDYYNRLITLADFAQFKVYDATIEEGKGSVLEETDNRSIPNLKGEILVAMDDGRLEYGTAIRDGKLGTMLVIKPKNDSKLDIFSNTVGEVHKAIFVEGLFEESASEVFNRDTKTIAAQQNADMKKYNYEQELSNGATVGYDKELKSYLKVVDNKGNVNKVPIPEDNMLKLLDESAIIDRTVDEILANMDENGNLYPQKIKGKMVQPDIDALLYQAASAGTEELFPKGSTTDVSRAAYQNQLYLKMKQILNGYLKNYRKQ